MKQNMSINLCSNFFSAAR